MEYIITGTTVYEPEALEFAHKEYKRRNITIQEEAKLAPRIVNKLNEKKTVSNPIEKVAHHFLADPPNAIPQLDYCPPKIYQKALLCSGCGYEVPTMYLTYYENIAFLFGRNTKSYRGFLCRNCNVKYFLQGTWRTIVFGWWGHISMPLAAGFILNNIMEFIKSLKIPPIPPNTMRPVYDQQLIEKLAAYQDFIKAGVKPNSDLIEFSHLLSSKAHVSPGEAWCYLQNYLKAEAQKEDDLIVD